jgi:hypothetical protein
MKKDGANGVSSLKTGNYAQKSLLGEERFGGGTTRFQGHCDFTERAHVHMQQKGSTRGKKCIVIWQFVPHRKHQFIFKVIKLYCEVSNHC